MLYSFPSTVLISSLAKLCTYCLAARSKFNSNNFSKISSSLRSIPSVSGKYGLIEFFVRQIEPGGSGVIQVRECALFLLDFREAFSI